MNPLRRPAENALEALELALQSTTLATMDARWCATVARILKEELARAETADHCPECDEPHPHNWCGRCGATWVRQ